MTVREEILSIQSEFSFPDKKMAELIGIKPFTYSKCKSEKELKNQFNARNLQVLKNNLKKLCDKFAQ